MDNTIGHINKNKEHFEGPMNMHKHLQAAKNIITNTIVVQALDTQIAIIAENQEKLEILNSRRFNFSGNKYPVEWCLPLEITNL